MPSLGARLDWVNIALMVVACAAAVLAPFHVFLFSYAILGPLHYLTEVSWLHDRNFFTTRAGSRKAWLFLVGVTAIVMAIGYVSSELLNRPVAPAVEIGMFLLVFVAANVALHVRHPVNALAVVALAVAGLFFFSGYSGYGIVAYLLVTIVHVFVFTGAFILAGAMKSRSRIGYLSLAVFLASAATALFIAAPAQLPGERVRAVYATFEQLNMLLLHGAGVPAGSVYAPAGLGVMRFIAFAYTYHYLNWFSKTSIIRWHAVSRGRGLAIAVTWAAGVALYLYSYRAGFAVFYVLSVVHVMLEFPLNHQTFVSLVRASLPNVRVRAVS
ncbi:MAG: hypothetical protein QOH21_3266 [Acidobacteriota bacterium]|jgi:hypothetical protein|nr:hypothetical protein [Acidobacteriota bacterium]